MPVLFCVLSRVGSLLLRVLLPAGICSQFASFLSLSVGSSLAQSVKDGVPCLLEPADSVTLLPFEFDILLYSPIYTGYMYSTCL